MPKRYLPTARKDELVIRELENETLVYDYRTFKAYCLNQTATLIWKSCNGRNAPGAIARLLEQELQTPVTEELVGLAINQFTKDNLLEAPSLPQPANGLSRREVIRRIGLTTAVALPVVVSLVAPLPAMAASSNCFCVAPGDCLAKTGCPSTTNCNGSGFCAP